MSTISVWDDGKALYTGDACNMLQIYLIPLNTYKNIKMVLCYVICICYSFFLSIHGLCVYIYESLQSKECSFVSKYRNVTYSVNKYVKFLDTPGLRRLLENPMWMVWEALGASASPPASGLLAMPCRCSPSSQAKHLPEVSKDLLCHVISEHTFGKGRELFLHSEIWASFC